MSGARWPQPIVATSDDSAVALVRQLWLQARRVDAAVADANRLRTVLGELNAVTPSRSVRILSARPPTHVGSPDWRWTLVGKLPGSDFILFYADEGSFPESALIFTGGLGSEGWVTFHQRPLVLHRLQQRFNALYDEKHPKLAVAVPSVREQPAAEGSDDGRAGSSVSVGAEPVTPAELYRRLLSAHFAGVSGDDRRPRLPSAPGLAEHQERAYERARAILDRFGGLIIADAVGLGKTYIGLRLLEETLQAGGRCLVVVPAALREQWERELAYLDDYAGIGAGRQDPVSTSSAEANLDLWVREPGGGGVALLSLESLGRKSFDSNAHRGADLVLIDEAHHFRNPSTRRYRNLANLLRHSKVVLLTATPINNTILDLQHLIDLFAAPSAFRQVGIPDYRAAFRLAAAGQGDVQAIISACVLRRTRRFLRTHYGPIRLPETGGKSTLELRFPERRPPVAVSYDLAATYGDLFTDLEQWLDSLHFPTIDPAPDHDGGSDESAGPAELLKIILLKRLESSMEAFRRTVVQQLAWCNTALRAIDAGRLLSRPDYRASFRGPADDPGSQLALFELMLPTPSIERSRVDAFRRLLESDLQILTRIHAALAAIGPAGDRKLQKLIDLLDGELAGRKILLFTEFRDTARYIYDRLKHRPHIAQIDSEGARLGLERAGRREVIERFAPHSNGLPAPPTRERVDLLIATDVLSEGLNLQDAAAVVSYDLPWNPVRLMQRIGRIDRLGALEESVELFHFVPARALDRLLGLMSRLKKKVSTIGASLGLDHPVLATASDRERTIAQIRALADERNGFERLEEEVEGPLDPEEQAYIDYVSYQKTGAREVPSLPGVSAVTLPGARTPRAVAYWQIKTGKRTRALWLVCDLETGCVVEDQGGALEALRSTRTRKRRRGSERLLESARRRCERYVRAIVAGLEAARIAGDALSPGLPQCRIAARLSLSFRERAHLLAPQDKAMIDGLLERLARRFTIAQERVLLEFAEQLGEQASPSLLEALHATLTRFESERPGETEIREVATLLLLPRHSRRRERS